MAFVVVVFDSLLRVMFNDHGKSIAYLLRYVVANGTDKTLDQ